MQVLNIESGSKELPLSFFAEERKEFSSFGGATPGIKGISF
jgi:hypothetical protein